MLELEGVSPEHARGSMGQVDIKFPILIIIRSLSCNGKMGRIVKEKQEKFNFSTPFQFEDLSRKKMHFSSRGCLFIHGSFYELDREY